MNDNTTQKRNALSERLLDSDEDCFSPPNPNPKTTANESKNDGFAIESKDIQNTENVNYYSVDEAISYIGVGYFQYRLLFLTGFIWAADAMEMMIITFLVPILTEEWSLHSPEDGMIGAVVFSGMLIGSSFWSIIADKYGRRIIVIASTLGCAIFGFLSALTPDIYLLLFARFLLGFCIGGSSVSYTLFAEYSPVKLRGKLLVIEQGFWSVGALVSVALAWISLSYLNWRWYLILSSVPLWLISIFYRYVPESALWLISCGKVEEAELALKEVADTNGKPLPNGKLRALNTIVIRGRLSDVFSSQHRSTSILLYILMFVCVFGYYGISFLSERFFRLLSDANAGATTDADEQQYWEMLITTSSELPSLVAGVFLIDRIGRKKCLYYSFAIFSVCSFLLIIPSIQESQIICILAVFFARMNISLGFLTLFVYFSEYYPTVIRTTALGCASALGRIAGILTSFVSADLSINIGMGLYGTAGVIAFVCSYALKSDTMGKKLSCDIEMENEVSFDPPGAETVMATLFSYKKDREVVNDMSPTINSSNTQMEIGIFETSK